MRGKATKKVLTPEEKKNGYIIPKKFEASFEGAKVIYEKVHKDTYTVFPGKEVINVTKTSKSFLDIAYTESVPLIEYLKTNTLESTKGLTVRVEPDYLKDRIHVTSTKDFSNYNKYLSEFDRNFNRDQIYFLGDKICLLSTNLNVIKKHGKLYYEKSNFKRAITLNLKTGCFYFIHTVTKNNKITSKKINKNQFRGLSQLESHNKIQQSTIEEFKRVLLIQFKKIEGLDESLDLGEIIIKWFVNFHGIKTTDNYIKNICNYYPRLSLLKRKKMNLTDAIMTRFKFKSNKIKKIINTRDDVNIFKLFYMYNFFGIDLLNQMSDIDLLKLCKNDIYPLNLKENSNSDLDSLINEISKKINSYNLSKSEINRFFKLSISQGFTNQTEIHDHITFRDEILEKTGQKIKFGFRNKEEFQDEHMVLTKILIELRKNYTTNITSYTNEFILFLEQPIYNFDEPFYNYKPVSDSKISNEFAVQEHNKVLKFKSVLLKTSVEYEEEGRFQSHCVGNYIKGSSHIVSLRNDQNKRCTIEIDRNGKIIQSKLYKNELPSEYWEIGINIIKDRFKQLIDDNKLLPKQTLDKPKEIDNNLLFKGLDVEKPIQLLEPNNSLTTELDNDLMFIEADPFSFLNDFEL